MIEFLLPHLKELRKRALKSLLLIIALFIPLFINAQYLFTKIAFPLISHLGNNMVAVDITSPFFVPIQLAIKTALVFAMPYILYQLLAFISPALYRREKRLLFGLVISSVILFYCGLLFCFFCVLPIVFHFLVSYVPKGVQLMPDIANYLTFISNLMLAFGIGFQMPIAVILLCQSNITSSAKLKQFRPYLIVFAFTIGMLLTPPDVISQILLAVPLCFLFEIGLFFAAKFEKKSSFNALSHISEKP